MEKGPHEQQLPVKLRIVLGDLHGKLEHREGVLGKPAEIGVVDRLGGGMHPECWAVPRERHLDQAPQLLPLDLPIEQGSDPLPELCRRDLGGRDERGFVEALAPILRANSPAVVDLELQLAAVADHGALELDEARSLELVLERRGIRPDAAKDRTRGVCQLQIEIRLAVPVRACLLPAQEGETLHGFVFLPGGNRSPDANRSHEGSISSPAVRDLHGEGGMRGTRTGILAAAFVGGLLDPGFLLASGWTELDARSERSRALSEDGPQWLLPPAEREPLLRSGFEERERFWEAWLARGFASGAQKLAAAIDRRLARARELDLAPGDVRHRLYWVRGLPDRRETIDCSGVLRPIELWTYGPSEGGTTAVVYRPRGRPVYELWLPTDSKRVLYEPDVEYFLEQYEELKGSIRATRPDLVLCKEVRKLDEATKIAGLFGYRRERPENRDYLALLEPPTDLAAWAARVLAEPQPTQETLPQPSVRVSFPELRNQRIEMRLRLELPPGIAWSPIETPLGRKEVRLVAAARLEQEGVPFEEFRVRFVFEPPAEGLPVLLDLPRLLRPLQRYVLRLRLEEEGSGKCVSLDRAIRTPAQAVPIVESPGIAAVRGEPLGLERATGRDSLVLIPPPQEIVFGLQRFEAIVVGDRIRKVKFVLDGKLQVTRSQPPWGAELRLPALPQELVVRVEGIDESGNLVAADELLLNQLRGEPRVKLLEPKRGAKLGGSVRARAAVVIPEERRIDAVEFHFNGKLVTRLTDPPWEAIVDTAGAGDLAYLSVIAHYSDGATVEDIRVFGSGGFLEELEVELVEFFVSVSDRDGGAVRGLSRDLFVLKEEGRVRGFERFEEVANLPLRVGLVLDTSGSMREVIEVARQAASGFLKSVMTPKDLGFTVVFSDRPRLLMPLVSDAGALELSLREVVAEGSTALHDALVLALYQLRAVRGQRALVLLSDGEDTASAIAFDDALNFARASGVSIYTIGLNIGMSSLGIREKLARLARETGGRVFYIDKAEQLPAIYRQIEEDLRSRYLLAFAPDPKAARGQFRRIEVEVRKAGLKARHAPGYAREP